MPVVSFASGASRGEKFGSPSLGTDTDEGWSCQELGLVIMDAGHLQQERTSSITNQGGATRSENTKLGQDDKHWRTWMWVVKAF